MRGVVYHGGYQLYSMMMLSYKAYIFHEKNNVNFVPNVLILHQQYPNKPGNKSDI